MPVTDSHGDDPVTATGNVTVNPHGLSIGMIESWTAVRPPLST